MKIIDPWIQVEKYDSVKIVKNIERACRTCFSKDIEILTDKGWKNISEVSDDLVLTYNKNLNKLEYEKSNLFSQDYNGKMIQSLHSQLSFCITPDHRIYYTSKYDKQRKNYKLDNAEKIFNQNNYVRLPKWFHKCQGVNLQDYKSTICHKINTGKGIKDFSIDISDDLLYLLGAYIAEGHVNHIKSYLENESREKKCGISVQITQSEHNKLYSKVIKSLDNLKLPYRIDCDPRKPEIKWIIITGGLAIANWFRKETGIDSYTKHLPQWFRNLSQRQLNILKDGLYDGDGSHSKTRGEKYISISNQLRDEVQELHILLGTSASKGEEYVEENHRDSWIINTRIHLKYIQYNDKVYCTQTKNGIVCIRLNNKTMWIGNCYRSENAITEDSYKRLLKNCINRGHESVLEHEKITIRMCCDVGTYKELTRHRFGSFSIESTRYCNYSKDKFENEIKFIKPCNIEYGEIYNLWANEMQNIEYTYQKMSKQNCTPDQMRMILPHSTAAEVMMTANIREWRHILSLRCSKATHPSIRQLLIPLL